MNLTRQFERPSSRTVHPCGRGGDWPEGRIVSAGVYCPWCPLLFPILSFVNPKP